MNKQSSGWTTKLLQAAGRLLSVSRKECLSCKQQADLDSKQLGLCNTCYQTIPWITEVLCPICGRYEACQDCLRRKDTFFTRSRSSVKYDDTMKELLARYKYRGDERLGALMGAMLKRAFDLQQAGEDDSPVGSVGRIITYVPVSERRMLERGFNQAEQMARVLGNSVKLPVVPLLRRVKHTDKQSFKKRSERLDDLEHVFQIDEEGLLQAGDLLKTCAAAHIYVTDDVYTTGSTMNQCAKVLQDRINGVIGIGGFGEIGGSSGSGGFGGSIVGLTWAR
ncbi:ComF family protein [Paenibacillus eucommiae]|uniref:ComF family protein n=1 Tax=Paenibacillus eucommiae TaxID=1355755 RepID=A0ABS4J0J5_9BACL|nr:ComF family protein [Paenibacillus eucommiae]MBP1992636.1 ComF family protein [Paenibacillus eucommiae]